MLGWRILPLVVVLTLVSLQPAAAQAPAPRLEIGAQVSTLRLSDFDATNAGVGGRLSFDLAPWMALEGDIAFFPRERVEARSLPDATTDLRLAYSRHRTGAFVGPKLGVRGDRFGLFGRVQPGLTRLTHRSVACIGDDCARVLLLLAPPEYRTEFAMHLGGVLEFYPSPRTVARLDLGTTLIRHRSLAPPCDDCTSRNLSSSLGLGFRF